MAKIKFGMVVTDMRGKLGGHVFTKNRAGASTRTKVTPANPRTASQQANRALLGLFSVAWSALTDAQRASWNGAVDAWSKTNIFGDNVKPSGKNLFTALNKNLASVGLDTINVAPEKVELPLLALDNVDIAVGDGEITVATGAIGAEFQVIVSATPPLSAGTSFTKGKYRRIYYGTGGAVSPTDLFDAYESKFGAIAVGQNIYFEVKIIASNGQVSVPETAKATISA
jgi:hypothetical protein